MSNRINGNTRTGHGDSGYTELISGKQLPKSHHICYIHNYLQKTINEITIWILKYNSDHSLNDPLLDPEDLRLLKELKNPTINNLAANLWCKLKNKEYIVSDDLIDRFNDRRLWLNQQFNNAREFILFSTLPSCELYNLCLDIRNIEHFCWTIIHEYDSYNPNSYSENSRVTGEYYNMLSDYLYNLCRFTEKKLAEKYSSPGEDYWCNDCATVESQLSSMG